EPRHAPVLGPYTGVAEHVRRHDLGHADGGGILLEDAVDVLEIFELLLLAPVAVEHEVRARTFHRLPSLCGARSALALARARDRRLRRRDLRRPLPRNRRRRHPSRDRLRRDRSRRLPHRRDRRFLLLPQRPRRRPRIRRWRTALRTDPRATNLA